MLLFLATCQTIFSSFRHVKTNWTCSISFDMSNERATSCCRRSWCGQLCRHVERSSIFIPCLFISVGIYLLQSWRSICSYFWSPYGIGQTIIFLSCGFFFCLFFLAYSQPSQIGCLPYFHTWCGLSANLGCRSETCCMRFAENTGRKNCQLECGPMPNMMATLPTIGGTLCWTPQSLSTTRVPCSNAANIGERETWTQSEFCTWQNSVTGQEPPKTYI